MTAWWMSSIPVWHHGGDGEPPMSAIHREVAVESEHATLRMLLCHADQAGIGQRQRDAGVSTHESRDVGQVLVQMDDDSNGPALEQLQPGAGSAARATDEEARLRDDRLAGQARRRLFGELRRGPAVVAIAPDDRARAPLTCERGLERRADDMTQPWTGQRVWS